MEIVWTAEAERHLSALADSFHEWDDVRVATEFVQKATDQVARLADTPYVGERLAGRRGAYRALTVDLWFKIIYRVVGHKVMVIAIWDCRHEPLDLTAILPR